MSTETTGPRPAQPAPGGAVPADLPDEHRSIVGDLDQIAYVLRVLRQGDPFDLEPVAEDIAHAREGLTAAAEYIEEVARADAEFRATDEGSQRCVLVPFRAADPT